MTRGFDAVGKALAGAGGHVPPGRAADPRRQDAGLHRRRRQRAAVGLGAPRAPGRSLGDAERFDGAALADALDAALAASSTSAPRAGRQDDGRRARARGRGTARAASTPARRSPTRSRRPRDAAEEGARATVPMQARKGRASYLGERSIGHQDPGATSAALIMRALQSAVAPRADGRTRPRGVPASPGHRGRRGASCSARVEPTTRPIAPRASGPPRSSARCAALDARGAPSSRRSPRACAPRAARTTPRSSRPARSWRATPALVDGGRARRRASRAGPPRRDPRGVPTRTPRRSPRCRTRCSPRAPTTSAASAVAPRGSPPGGADAPPSRPRRDPRRRRPRARRRRRAGRSVRGVALAGGGATAHAAIVARGRSASRWSPGSATTCSRSTPGDADRGRRRRRAGRWSPAPERARAAARARTARGARARARRAADARRCRRVTRDGHRVTRARQRRRPPPRSAPALDAGAEGVGLLRTELAFLDARAGRPRPTTAARSRRARRARRPHRHRARARLRRRQDAAVPARRRAQRGIELLLDAPEALRAQLRAIVAAGADTRAARPAADGRVAGRAARRPRRSRDAARAVGAPVPPLGAMVETPEAAAPRRRSRPRRGLPQHRHQRPHRRGAGHRPLRARRRVAHHPRVLGAIAATVARPRSAPGIRVEVCGEAASDPVACRCSSASAWTSSASARRGSARCARWVRALDHARASRRSRSVRCARRAGRRASPRALAARAASVEGGDAVARARRAASGGVVAARRAAVASSRPWRRARGPRAGSWRRPRGRSRARRCSRANPIAVRTNSAAGRACRSTSAGSATERLRACWHRAPPRRPRRRPRASLPAEAMTAAATAPSTSGASASRTWPLRAALEHVADRQDRAAEVAEHDDAVALVGAPDRVAHAVVVGAEAAVRQCRRRARSRTSGPAIWAARSARPCAMSALCDTTTIPTTARPRCGAYSTLSKSIRQCRMK